MCRRVVGYPPKFKRKKKGQTSSTASSIKSYARGNIVAAEFSAYSQGEGRYISEDHYQQLLNQKHQAISSTLGDIQSNMIGTLA